jgi:hypothetical protein
MSGRARYYSQPYSRLDDDQTWSTNIADADPEHYDPTTTAAKPGNTGEEMPLEPYPHYQADYGNPLNRYSAQLPSSEHDSPTRPASYYSRDSRPTSYRKESRDAIPASYHDKSKDARRTSYQPDYQPEYEDFEALKHRSARPAKAPRRFFWTDWSRKRKWIICGGIAATVIILIIIIAVAVALSVGSNFKYTPKFNIVTNEEAFTTGGATHNSVNDTNDGIGAGQDTYTYYQGDETNFPPLSSWISFDDMWNNNLPLLQTSCSGLDLSPDNSPEVIQDIYNAIQTVANVSLVDHRYIFATVLQESNGCVQVGHTTSSGGVTNPGLMQSHNGKAFDKSAASQSILQMITDGTQGTADGWGLVQNLNHYGNVYKASRGYNSGYVPKSGDLSTAAGATACYVTDIANRLTGWTTAKSTCPDDTV